jgi:hypothetical protein
MLMVLKLHVKEGRMVVVDVEWSRAEAEKDGGRYHS